MSKARIIFIVLAVYILVASFWWIYAHYQNTLNISKLQKELMETQCFKASVYIHEGVEENLFADTLKIQQFVEKNFPELEVAFLDINQPLKYYVVRPKASSYENKEKIYQRKIFMYSAEGTVMMLLLLWGIGVIYQSFRKELFLKKLQNNFLLSVTHELKTPITAMNLYLETLLRRQVSPEQSREIIKNSLNESKRLQEQVEKLLLSAQLDSNKYELDLQTLNLSELLDELIANFNRPLDVSRKINSTLEEQVFIKGDPWAWELILNNLMSNAMKYGNSGPIDVILKHDNQDIIIHVKDHGEGIADLEKRLLFSKFYRGGDENTRKTKGTGLGLFIVKHLVELHHGKISVHNNQPKGTIFEIKLHANAE